MKQRRQFLKNVGALGLGMVLPSGVFGNRDLKTLTGDREEEAVPETACGDSGERTVTIFQTTDVHCQVHPHDELYWENGRMVFRKAGGYAVLATMLKKLRSKSDHSFLIDTGDMFQGSALSVETTGEAFIPILDALNYDLYLPGNWEVIYGKKRMQTLLGSLKAPKICANMYHDLGEGKRGELIFQPYHIWSVEGIKIGFLGYTDHLVPIRQSPNYSKGIVYTKPEENLAHYVEVLKEQEKCEMIIILAHLGLSQQLHLANLPACQGVNYIMGGDTHERVRKPIQCTYAKVVEPGAFGSFVGSLTLTVKDGKLLSEKYELLDVDPNRYKADEEMQRLIASKEHLFKDKIDKVIGYSTIPLYRYFVIENPIDTMVVAALKWKFPGTDIALSNGFRFCPPRVTPDASGNIPITNGYLFDMLPVDSPIRFGEVTGQQILDWLEKEMNNVFAKDASKRFGGWVVKFNGMKVQFKAFEEMGKRIVSVEIGDRPLDVNAVYGVMACERDGDPLDVVCRMTKVANVKRTDYTLQQIMREYISANSPLTPTPSRNCVALDTTQELLTQVTGVDYQFH